MTFDTPAEALRGRLPDLYFVNASAAQMEHHQKLLARLPQEKLIIEFLQPEGTFLTELSLCAYDQAQPGLLAKICNALNELNIIVHTASIFTLREETPVILDILRISDSYLGHDRRLGKSKQNQARLALESVLNVSETDVPLAKPLLERALKVQEISIESAHQEQKLISIRTTKNKSAVFRMAAAMASLGLDIQTAQIHQSDKEVQGLFFVTGEAEGDIEYQLRFALQSSALPNLE